MTRREREGGAALLMTLALLLVVSTAGAAFCLRVAQTARSNVSARKALAARLAAEAGIERARAALSADSRYADESFSFEGFDVAVTATPAGEGVDVRSSAVSATVRAGITARLGRSPGLPPVLAWRER